MASARNIPIENFRIPQSSPFFDKFAEDVLEQLCVDLIFAQDEKKLRSFELEDKLAKYRENQEKRDLISIKPLLSRITPENVQRTLRCSDKLKLRLNKENEPLSEVTLNEESQRAIQMPSDLISSGEQADRLRFVSSRMGAIQYLYKPDVSLEQIKGQWYRKRAGKKQGGLVQRDPSTAKIVLNEYGSFFSYLILSYPLVAKGSDAAEIKSKQKQLEMHLLELLHSHLETTLRTNFDITSVLDAVYNSFGFVPAMVDEIFLRNAIRKYFNDKYEIVYGYIQKKNSTIGMQSNLDNIRIDSFINHSQLKEVKEERAVKTEAVVAGDAKTAALEQDKKFALAEISCDFGCTEEEKNDIQQMALKNDEKMETDEVDFFVGGGGSEIPGMDEFPEELDETVKNKNRSYDVTLKSLAEEFRRCWNEKSPEDGYFVDYLIEDVKTSELEFDVFERNLQTVLRKFYTSYLEAQVAEQRKFPLKVRRVYDEICGTWPNDNEEFKDRNKFFVRKEFFDLRIQETVELMKTELQLMIEWERNEFVIKKIDSKGNVKMETGDALRRRQLPFVEVREYIPPARQRDWRKLTEIVAASVEKRFEEPASRLNPIYTGVHKYDQEPPDGSLLSFVHENINSSVKQWEFKSHEVEAAFWKIVLDLPESPPIKYAWFLMPFVMSENDPCSGLEYIQYLHNRNDENSKVEIINWSKKCPLPNQLSLYEAVKVGMKELIRPNRALKIEDVATEMYYNPDVRDALRPYLVNVEGDSQSIELEKPTRITLIEKTVLIVVVQNTEMFKFDKNIVYRVSEKRKRELSPVATPSKDVQNVSTILHNMKNIDHFTSDALDLLNHFLSSKEKDLKKESEEMRPTVNKEIESFFRPNFRLSMIKQGLFDQVGWTVLAEIVVMRTGGPKMPPISLTELANLYPHYRVQLLKDIGLENLTRKQKSRIPQWRMHSINQAVFELENGGIFDVQHEFTAGDVAKSVQIRMDENKFRRLMNEITSNIERRSK